MERITNSLNMKNMLRKILDKYIDNEKRKKLLRPNSKLCSECENVNEIIMRYGFVDGM